MTKDELIIKQQLELEEFKLNAKENEAVVNSIKRKFISIGEPLNDNFLNFNKSQMKWCFEVFELVENVVILETR